MADIRPVTKVEGPDASDATITQNPVVIGGRSSDAVVTPVSADNENVAIWLSRRGTVMMTDLRHVGLDGSPFQLTQKGNQFSGGQSGTAIWTPGSGKKIAVTYFQLQAEGTTSGFAQLWFGASGDTTYNRGTDIAIFDGHFIPSATFSPGVAVSGLWISSTADHVLKFSDSAAINTMTVNVWGYEF